MSARYEKQLAAAPHARDSFEQTSYRPRTQQPLAMQRRQLNQQETRLETHQKIAADRVPTADKMDRTKTFPSSSSPPATAR
jgi:hypothetical protein